MSFLKVYSEDAQLQREVSEPAQIASELNAVGVRFEQWQPDAPVKAGDSQQAILSAYKADIDRLVAEDGFQTVDVISIDSSHPDKASLRQKFLSEHTHSEHEVRFFVDGQGLFYLHINDRVYGVLCEKGDLISVPAGTTHWFDLGANPTLAAIRFFNNPDGWVAQFSGSPIAEQFPLLAE